MPTRRSLAATSVCGYLCGVGDRHWGNMLLCQRTGQLVGIDFGYAFGTATTVGVSDAFAVTEVRCAVAAVAPGLALAPPQLKVLDAFGAWNCEGKAGTVVPQHAAACM